MRQLTPEQRELRRESGRYDECRAALARASEAALRVKDVEMADASIPLSRALLAIEPDIWQPDEGAALLDVVEPIFARARTVRGTLFCLHPLARSILVIAMTGFSIAFCGS